MDTIGAIMLTYSIAFISGFLSFFSPCVFPVMPGYLCFVTGQAPQEQTQGGWKSWVVCLTAACAFVLGFGTVFVALGSLASQVHVFFTNYKDIILKAGGLLVIFFGLATLGWIRMPAFLQRDVRWHPSGRLFEGAHPVFLFLGSYIVGMAFGLGWTPCVGPILGSILVLAAQTHSAQQGVYLLIFYTLGLGIPLLLMAIFFQAFMRYMPGLTRFMPAIRLVSGVLLIVMGVMIWTDALRWLAIS